jgi:hypothetical protein
MRIRLKRFESNVSGSSGVLFALAFPVLIGAAVMGTEVGYWAFKHRAMQGATDAAALSAVASGYLDNSATQQAEAITAARGFAAGINGVLLQVHAPPQTGAYAGRAGAVEVRIQQPKSPMIASFLSRETVTLRARSIAIRKPGGACVLALNPAARGAITVQGTAIVTLKGCDALANSADSKALEVGGSAALNVNAASAVGGIDGVSKITAANGTFTGVAPLADPYANRFYPPYSGCTQTYSGGSTTLYPGVYCGGLSITSSSRVFLNPGIYYLDGGPLKMTGTSTLEGTGVTLVFTSSTGVNYAGASISGDSSVNLKAPTSGPTQGIVIFGDRSMTLDTPFKETGSGAQNWGGTIYIPRGALTYAGGAAAATGCTQIIADTVIFTGNSSLALNCEGYGTTPLGTQIATLVE